jgi:hypothetical protein
MWSGRENIEYAGAQHIASICVDVGSIANPHHERWLCMSQGDAQ